MKEASFGSEKQKKKDIFGSEKKKNEIILFWSRKNKK